MAQKYKKMQLMGLSAEKNVLLPPSPVPYSKKNMLDIHTHRRENRFRALYSLTPPRGFRPEEGVFYSVGIHPWVEREYRQGLFCPWEELEALAARPEVRAVGEAGLDWARRPLPDFSPACLHELPSPGGAQRAESRRRSVELLERQALLAARVGKPLVLHCVKAVDDIVALHRRLRPDVPWILHGYRGNPQQAAQLVRRGLCLSLGERFHPGAAACIPADRLLLETDESLESKLLTNLIEYAQKQIEGRNFATRKNVLQYDDVMNKQRMIMYAERMRVIRGENVHEQVLKYIPGYVEGVLRETVNIEDSPEKWSESDLNTALERYLLPEGTNYVTREKLEKWDYDVALKRISDKTAKCYEEKIARIKEEMPGVDFGRIERDILLSYVNSNWIDHIDAMDQLRKGIGLRSYGQTDPVIAYKQEGFAMFDEMVERIQERTIRFLLKCQIKAQPRPVQRIFPSSSRPAQPAPAAGADAGAAQVPARNEQTAENAPARQPEQTAQEAAEAVGTEALPKAVDVDSLRTSGDVKFNPATLKKGKKVGPNDPCPCGSGLKYKKCHGRPY